MTLRQFLGTIEDPAPPAPFERLASFEEILGHRLPEDYRQFLGACNGGYVRAGVGFQRFDLPDAGCDIPLLYVHGFTDPPHESLEAIRAMYAEAIPAEYVWVINDLAGNGVCIGVAGEVRGRIFLWDHEGLEDPEGLEEGEVYMIPLAGSFTEFVERLRFASDM